MPIHQQNDAGSEFASKTYSYAATMSAYVVWSLST